MGAITTLEEINLGSANGTFGRRECYAVTVNDTAANLDGEYFTVEVPTGANGGASTAYYVWFNLDAGSVDPSPGGSPIEVAVVTGDTAAQVATKLAAALDAEADFFSSVNSVANTEVIMEARYQGSVDNPAADGTTGFVITQAQTGLYIDLGLFTGDIEVAFETTSVQVTAAQSGSLVRDEFLTGQTVEVSLSALEMTPLRWSQIVGEVAGANLTPSGGSQVTGFGESRLYQSLFSLGGILTFHPVGRAASDRSYDLTLPKCAPKPGAYTLSPENPTALELTFTALADRSINSAVNLFIFGDFEQDFR